MEPSQAMSGVRVVELTTFGFVPSGVALLADWGADVIKLEHPRVPDPMRGLVTAQAPDGSVVDTLMDHFNRGKRNLAVDLGSDEGRSVLDVLIREADVFITSFLKPAQRKLRVTADDLRSVNPRLIYAHGHGYGPRGADADQPGFDSISYWARGGVGHALTFEGGPPAQQRAAFGDVMGGLSVATGVAAALYRRSVTGEGCTVDVSLLSVACWQLAPDILRSSITGSFTQSPAPTSGRAPYRTADGRFVTIPLLLPHYLPNLLQGLDRADLLEQPSVAAFRGGVDAPAEIDTLLREAIGALTAAELRVRLRGREIAWSVMQSPDEVLEDPQVVANEYVVPLPSQDGRYVVAGPVQFDQRPPGIASGAPRQGEHTGAILRELGFEEDAIQRLLEQGVVRQGAEGGWDDHGRLRS